MSTKTSIKRIALVAVAALGFGMVSTVVPANAATSTTDVPTAVSATLDNTKLTYAGRIGQQVSIDITGSTTATTAATGALPYLSIAAALTSQPTSSAIYPSISSATAPTDGTVTLANIGSAKNMAADGAATTVATAAITSAGSATQVATVNYSAATKQSTAFGAIASGKLATITFTPTVAGTYTLTVWNEKDRTVNATGTDTQSFFAATESALSGTESYKTFQIIVSSGLGSLSITNLAPTSTLSGSNGSLLKVCAKDAAGNIAIPATGEVVTVTPSGSAFIAKINNSTAGAGTAGAAVTLAASAFSVTSGCAWLNVRDTASAAEDVTVVASTASLNASTTISFKAKTDVASGYLAAYNSTATGYKNVSDGVVRIPVGAVSTTFRYAGTADNYTSFTVTELAGLGLGQGGNGYAYDAAVKVGSTGYASITIAASSTAATANLYKVTASGTTNDTTIASYDNTAASLTISPATVNAAPAAKVGFTATLKDYFGRAYANQTLSFSVTGRNPSSLATAAATDANGQATFSLTDANTTSSLVSDTVSVSGPNTTSATATVLYGSTNVPSKVVLTSTGDDDVVAGTTTTDIDASYTGATGKYATASAVVTNAAGAAVAGTPVTFTVTGLTGAEVWSTTSTVYTDATGTAVAKISSYAAGSAKVTATAGTATDSDTIYFAQADATEARTISATTANGVVTATVKDRYGNPIKGVYVWATRSGSAFFGNGVSSTNGVTDKNGQVDFVVNGSGTVTLQLGSSSAASATYGQSYAAAGYDYDAVNGTAVTAYVAGTSAVAQKGLGGSLAPAGINSVTVDVTGGTTSSDAVDAANEATDAANAATDAANAAAEAADAATAAAQDAQAAVAALATQVSSLIAGIKAQITTLTNLVIKIQKKVRA